MNLLTEHFKPEFINRIDETVVFKPLEREQINVITVIQTEQLRKRLQDKDLTLDFTQDALNKLSDLGYDPLYGARPLKRVIRQEIENPLAQHILSGKFVANDIIKVDYDVKHAKFEFNN